MSETKLVKIIPRPAAWDEVRKPLTANVNEQNPLEVDLMTSFRSGYCYLAMDRYAALQRDYYVKVNVRFIRPVLMRDPEMFLKSTDYRYLYDPMDMGIWGVRLSSWGCPGAAIWCLTSARQSGML